MVGVVDARGRRGPKSKELELPRRRRNPAHPEHDPSASSMAQLLYGGARDLAEPVRHQRRPAPPTAERAEPGSLHRWPAPPGDAGAAPAQPSGYRASTVSEVSSPPRFPLGPALRPWPEDPTIARHLEELEECTSPTRSRLGRSTGARSLDGGDTATLSPTPRGGGHEDEGGELSAAEFEVSVLRSQLESLTAILLRGVDIEVPSGFSAGDTLHVWLDPNDEEPAWRCRGGGA